MNSLRERFSRPGGCALILLILLPAVFLARPAAAEPLVYVAMPDQNAVAVIDIANNTVISTIPVGSHPGKVAVSPDGNTIYATNLDSASVSVIDAASATVVATITVGARPWGLALAPDGSRLFVANYDSGSISVINTISLTTEATVAVGAQPDGVAVSRDGSRIWVSHYYPPLVTVIDAATLNATILSYVELPYGPSDLADLAVSADGSRIFTTTHYDGSAAVLVIDSSTGLVTNIIWIGGHYAQGIAVAPDGGHAIMAGESGIHSIDLTNFTRNSIGSNLDNGFEVAYAPDGRRVYATYWNDDDYIYYLLVIDAANYNLLTAIPLPGQASGVAVAPMTAIPVTIDIKPGPEVIALSPGSNGSVPVAILSTVDFSAPQQVDAASLRLAGAAVKIASNGKLLCHAEDVNFDGFNDLTCQFSSRQLTLAPGAVIVQLTGTLLPAYGSSLIQGEDEINKSK